jgi:hypothetical protein
MARGAVAEITKDKQARDLLLKLARRRAQLMVRFYMPEVRAIAGQLRDKKILSGVQIEKIVARSLKKRRRVLRTW